MLQISVLPHVPAALLEAHKLEAQSGMWKMFPGEINRREAELGSPLSWVDFLAPELFNSCFSDTVFVTVPHNSVTREQPGTSTVRNWW